MDYEFEVRCSYCGLLLGYKPAGKLGDFALKMLEQGQPLISHGVCENCKKAILAELQSEQNINQ